MNDALLDAYLLRFKDRAPRWMEKIRREFLDSYYAFFRDFLKEENLQKAVWEDFQKVGQHLHSLSGNALARARAFGKPNHPIERYRQSFLYLVYGSDPIEVRIARFVDSNNDDVHLSGIGRSATSEIVGYAFADRYCFYNKRDRDAVEKIGIDLAFERGDDEGIKYVKFNKAIEPVIRRYQEIVGRITTFPVTLEVDQFFSWLYSQAPPSDEKPKEETAVVPAVETAAVASPSRPRSTHALNTIFYGPPGTGKTYLTARRAVEIIDGPRPASERREALMARFKSLREAGAIEFVSFHQSFGYEDFVAGIRPDVEASELSYELTAGAFKVLCDRANRPRDDKVTSAHRQRPNLNLAAPGIQFWKMSLGRADDLQGKAIYDDCIENGYALLGWGEGVDYTGCNDVDAIRARHDALPKREEPPFGDDAVDRFKNRMKVGDVVLVSQGNRLIRAIGRVTGDYEHHAAAEFGQKRTVEWLSVLDPALPRERLLRVGVSQQTIYQLDRANVDTEALGALLAAPPEAPPRYVLIVDEINRGNISKIFGELITLLEDDKRVGQPNELRVKLAGVEEPFGVPDNVYVIGTMNTADRSIAFLDTALRRRFRFEEMMPDTKALAEILADRPVASEFDVPTLLEAINKRLCLLYDRNHQIGHAYFAKVHTLADLRDVFRWNVIPLLQEYFYDDWFKLCLVLGCPCDRTSGKALSNNARPIVDCSMLLSRDVFGVNDAEVDDRPSFSIDPGFYTAESDDLKAYLNGVVAVAKPSA